MQHHHAAPAEGTETRDLINQYLKDMFFRILDIQANYVSIATQNKLSRTEMHSIEIIKELDDPIVTEVAEKLRVSKATASVSIERLVKKGFVKKHKFEHDKRKFYLELTETGDGCYDQHKAFHDQMVQALLTDFKIDEYPELLRGLKNLAQFFDQF